MELFCARTTNHKQSLIINPACSFSASGSTENLASACDSGAAEPDTPNATERKKRVKQHQAYVITLFAFKVDFGATFLMPAPYKYHAVVRTYLSGLEWCQIQRSLYKILIEKESLISKDKESFNWKISIH